MSTFVAPEAKPIWHSALPLAIWWVGLPLWWALGLQRAAALLVAIPLALWLLRRRRQIAVPIPFIIFLSFIAWVLLSAFAVTSMRYGASYGMRLAMYVAAFVIGLYVWSALHRGLSPRLLIWCVVSMWASAVLLTFPGMLHGGLSFTSPVEFVLQHAGIHNDFLRDSSHPQFSEWDQVYGVARPSPLFAYTNEWGAAIGLMTPVATYAMLTTTRPVLKYGLVALLMIAVIPIIVSLNRGCWISLAVAVLYVLGRRALAGDFKPLAGFVSIAVVGWFVIASSSLSDLIADRFSYSNTSTRSTLYETSVTMATRSPLIGYGAPQSSAGIADSNDVAIGTHGQLWTLLVSQGFIGTGLFVLALLAMFWICRPLRATDPEMWLHAVGLVVIVQLVFYDVVPDGLSVAFVALAICASTAGRFKPPATSSSPAMKSIAAPYQGIRT